jgi:hypothetical protein
MPRYNYSNQSIAGASDRMFGYLFTFLYYQPPPSLPQNLQRLTLTRPSNSLNERRPPSSEEAFGITEANSLKPSFGRGERPEGSHRRMDFAMTSICVVSNYDYSRPLSRLRGMDLAVDYRGCFPSACASASLEALNSLPTLDPQLQVLAHGISYTLRQFRYVQLLLCSVCDLTTNGRRIFHYSPLPLPS